MQGGVHLTQLFRVVNDPRWSNSKLLKYCTKESDMVADREWFLELTSQLHKMRAIATGVLADGTSFLTGRTLSKMCGVSPSSINDWGEEVPERGDRLRGGKMADLLAAQGFEGVRLFDKIHAYPDSVCMAFLEYYAFEAGRNCTEEAKTNYRVLARKSLQDFIYRSYKVIMNTHLIKPIYKLWVSRDIFPVLAFKLIHL
jgi:hypothetical protein